MREDTRNQTTTAANKPKTPPDAPPSPSQAAPPKPARTRSAVSMERQLALIIIAVLAACDKAKVTADSEIGKALAPGRQLVKELQEKVIQPIKDRIAAVQKELQAAVADVSKIDATIVKEKSQELARLQKKLTGLAAPASAPAPAS